MNHLSAIIITSIVLLTIVYVIRKVERQRWQNKLSSVRELQEKLAEVEIKRHELLLDGLSDALLLVGRDGGICYANDAAKKLFVDRVLIGLAPQEVFPDSRFIDAISKSETKNTPIITRIILPQQLSPLGSRENRGANAWLLDVAPLPKEAYPHAKTRILLRDLTIEYQSEQVRKDFVANASHELRTPLAIIQGYLENLLEDGALTDKNMAGRFLSIMSKHTDRVSRIVEDMLVISRLESGEAASLSIEPFSFLSCAQDVVERLEHLTHSQQATVTIYIDEHLQISGDRFYWTQVLFNLVENALKQNPRPGLHVVVKGHFVGHEIHLSVSDDGIGIPSSHLPFIFKRFYRVDQNHTNSAIKGTGLGLSIVKRAVEAHGGEISVTSTPGKETRFLIVLPSLSETKDSSSTSVTDAS